MGHLAFRFIPAFVVWSFLVRHGATNAWEGRSALLLDWALALFGGLLGFLFYSGTTE
jgi:hypothetical protein